MSEGKDPQKMVSVILAAGKGTRMQVPYLHKVCFPLDGKPVITRAIETYQRCGIDSHVVVVGPMAEQVMQAASLTPANLFFCHQPEQRGTGNAAKMAAKLLRAMDFDGDVLLVVGDKVLEDEILHRLIDTFYANNSDLAFVVGDVNDFPSSGRIIVDGDRKILGNVEVFDIARMQLLIALRHISGERMIPPEEAESLALSYLKKENKAAVALGSLWDSIKLGSPVSREMIERDFDESDFRLQVGGKDFPPELLANVAHVNLSVYLFRAAALYDALDKIGSDNAQREEYLTDAIGILSSKGYRLDAVPIAYPQQAMAYNTAEELREIEEYIVSRKQIEASAEPRTVRTTREWLRAFETAAAPAMRYLSDVYGDGYASLETKRRLLISLLRNYLDRFGDEPVVITRAPGRVNIMGRHIDHQGGCINTIGIDRDFYLIIGETKDRTIHLGNLESHLFADRRFDLDEVMSGYAGGDWLDFVNSSAVKDRLAAAPGDWMQYVIAPLVRLQAEFPDRKLKGMNILGAGNIPIASGLSSSSAVVVATAEGAAHLNGIDLAPERFVELCGEAEWYVGTRGGAGDHSAMKYAQKGQVVRLGFFPFGFADTMPFPADYVLVVCNSHEKARKTAGAKDVFNHRVACYHIGRELFKQAYPEHAPAVQHLRDINVETLGIGYPELIRMLKALPMNSTRSEVESRLPSDVAQRYLSTHSDIFDSYPVRAVVIFGLAEAERCGRCADLLRQGGIEEFGRWMNASHDGDRVVMWDHKGNSWPFAANYADEDIDKLAAAFEAGHDDASLALQYGAYACSIPQIDRMVDAALSVEGVLGAQLAGAGLGGCIMVLAHGDSVEDLERALIRHYYEPYNLEPDIFPCHPVMGSGVVSF